MGPVPRNENNEKKKKKKEYNGRGAQLALGAHGVRSGVQDAFREE